MSEMNLSTLCILFGLVVALVNLVGVVSPVKFAQTMRRFPRSLPLGYILMLLGTGIFIWFVKNEPISDFEPLKPALYTLFLAVGVGSCLFVKDFLAVRGMSVLLLLLAKVMVDAARWHDSSWRLVITVWAYVFVIMGIVFTISPYKMRDLIIWSTSSEKKTRVWSAIRMALGVFVLVLGCTVLK
jgi:hypothetical protein